MLLIASLEAFGYRCLKKISVAARYNACSPLKKQDLGLVHLKVQYHKSHKMETEHHHILSDKEEFSRFLAPLSKDQNTLQRIDHHQSDQNIF